KYIPIRSHTEIMTGINNSTIIDDSWSSNPTSMKAALDVLSNIGKNKYKIAIIGKINYLGKYKNDFYKEIAKEITNKKVDLLITIDSDAKKIGKYAANLGMDQARIVAVDSKDELRYVLSRVLNANSVALFKTSMLDNNSQEILQEMISK